MEGTPGKVWNIGFPRTPENHMADPEYPRVIPFRDDNPRRSKSAGASSESSMSSCDVWHGFSDGENIAQHYKSFRNGVYHFLNPHTEKKASLATLYQFVAAVVIIGLFVVDSKTGVAVTTPTYWWIEFALFIVWSVEHLLRLWSCVEQGGAHEDLASRCKVRLFFALTPVMILEFFSLCSLVVDLSIVSNSYRGIAALRMLRLLTLYRIERDFNIFTPVIGVLLDKRKELFATLGIAGLVLSVASVLMFYIEAPYNESFESVLMSMWWCTTALTTVGYGDIVPLSGPGRFLASIVAFMGTGMFGLFAAILADGFRESIKRDRRYKRKNAHEEGKDDAVGRLNSAESTLSAMTTLQTEICAVIDERMRQRDEEEAARTALLHEEIRALRLQVQEAVQTIASLQPLLQQSTNATC